MSARSLENVVRCQEFKKTAVRFTLSKYFNVFSILEPILEKKAAISSRALNADCNPPHHLVTQEVLHVREESNTLLHISDLGFS